MKTLKTMQLQTIVDIPQAAWNISHTDRIMLLGSCFADNIGVKLKENGFNTLVNPFGTLYNPASIAALLLRSISCREYKQDSQELFFDGTHWHSWMHHSRFSAENKEELIRRCNEALTTASAYLETATVLIVTLGTSYIYRLNDSGMLVANCHKQPDTIFTRQRISSYDIIDQWVPLLQLLHSFNPQLHVIFTVSPIRHKRDGFHANQLSKAELLLATDQIVDTMNECTTYFPSFEIMMDELRDYRFYADDFVHPTPLAVDYIWQRFQQTFMSSVTIQQCFLEAKAGKQAGHREIVKSE